MTSRFVRTLTGAPLPRRKILRGGLATFATIMMSRTLGGCGGDGGTTGADGGTPGLDAFVPPMDDAGMHPGFPDRTIPAPPALRSLIGDIGPLSDTPDANGLRLPAGFTSRVIAQAGETVGGYEWHTFPDGGATYATEDGGWIYVSNSELPRVGRASGGVGAVRFSASGEIVRAYRILDGTTVNCAGGKTPWHTWLSGEEADQGMIFECDPWGEVPGIARPALGVFKHEAAAIDPVRNHVFLTEDVGDGRFYRFVPASVTGGRLDLTAGTLEVAIVDGGGNVTWAEVPDPLFTGGTPTRRQVAASMPFDGGEGIWYHEGVVYFSTKGDGRIWAYDAAASSLSVLYDAKSVADPVLTGVDNITVSCCGDVLVAEDGGSMDVVAILPGGELKQLVQVVGQDTSEITGPAFDPSGTRLYFSSQRGGASSRGMTWEVTGPFHEPA